MNIYKEESCIYITHTLKGGTLFKFVAEQVDGGFDLYFDLNGETELEYVELTTGERMEVSKLLRRIWLRFSKYQCCCIGASDYHIEVYRKLGFYQKPNFFAFDLYYEP